MYHCVTYKREILLTVTDRSDFTKQNTAYQQKILHYQLPSDGNVAK